MIGTCNDNGCNINVVGIRADLLPPDGANSIFLGCGQSEESLIQLGAVIKASEFFHFSEYEAIDVNSSDITVARSYENFYIYDQDKGFINKLYSMIMRVNFVFFISNLLLI